MSIRQYSYFMLVQTSADMLHQDYNPFLDLHQALLLFLLWASVNYQEPDSSLDFRDRFWEIILVDFGLLQLIGDPFYLKNRFWKT